MESGMTIHIPIPFIRTIRTLKEMKKRSIFVKEAIFSIGLLS